MSATITAQTIRLTADHTQAPGGLASVFDSGEVKLWRGNPLNIQLLLTSNGTIVDIAGYDWIKVEVFASQAENLTPLMSATLAAGAAGWDAACTVSQWEARTGQHAVVSFSAAETLLDLDAATSKSFWMVVSAAPSGTPSEPVTFGAAFLTVYEDATPGDQSGAIQPGNLIPNGATYDGSGLYTVTVTAGRVYRWEKSTHDTSCVNGSITLTATGTTTANGTTFVLHGSAGQSVTATLAVGVFFTADEALALFLTKQSGTGNPNGTYYGNLGDKYYQTDTDPWTEWTYASGTRGNDKWV
jgi:hypothetical protein